MAHMLRNLRVPQNSASLEEARTRTFEFFRMCCRSIPQIMEIYNLDDVVSPSQLRSAAAAHVRKNASVTDPRVLSFDPLLGFNPKLIGVLGVCLLRKFHVFLRLCFSLDMNSQKEMLVHIILKIGV